MLRKSLSRDQAPPGRFGIVKVVFPTSSLKTLVVNSGYTILQEPTHYAQKYVDYCPPLSKAKKWRPMPGLPTFGCNSQIDLAEGRTVWERHILPSQYLQNARYGKPYFLFKSFSMRVGETTVLKGHTVVCALCHQLAKMWRVKGSLFSPMAWSMMVCL